MGAVPRRPDSLRASISCWRPHTLSNLSKFCVMKSTAKKEGTQDVVRIRRNHFVVNKPVSAMPNSEPKSPSAMEMLKNLAAREKVSAKTSTADGSTDGSASKPLLIDPKIAANNCACGILPETHPAIQTLGYLLATICRDPKMRLLT